MSDTKQLTLETEVLELNKKIEELNNTIVKKDIEIQKLKEKIVIDVEQQTPHNIEQNGINTNLGRFTTAEPNPVEIKIQKDEAKVDAVEAIAIADVDIKEKSISTDTNSTKLDFEKFERHKSKRSTTKFGVKINIWLNQRKPLIIIWIMILSLILILWAVQIVFVVLTNNILYSSHSDGPASFPWMHNCAMTGTIFCYISIGLPIVPFIYLLTTVVIGVNGVYKNKSFHYFVWGILLVCFTLFIVDSILCGIYLEQYYSFIPAHAQ